MLRSWRRKSAERSTTLAPRSRSRATTGAAAPWGYPTIAASTSGRSSSSMSSSGTRWCGYSASSGVPTSSPRAVTAASSKWGWRCRIRAAIAPANPAAPMTATVSATELGPEPVGERRDDLLPLAARLVLGQRAVGRAELEVERERRLPGADPLAPVGVEDPDAAEQRRGAPRRGDDVGGGHVGPDHDGDVLADHREEPELGVGLGRGGRQPAEIELEEGRGRKVPRRRHRGMELAEVAEVAHPRAAAGMEERLARGRP